MFYEITKSGVLEGMRNATELDMNLVNAQQARRIIDRLVGFKVSPFLWKVLYSGLSAGRVQSVALRLICERQEEIDKFEPQEYWTIKAELETKAQKIFEAELLKVDGKKLKLVMKVLQRQFVEN
jgi:DNA topoisomerase-1